MKLFFVTSECDTFVKTGGLGDVAYALPRALAKNPGIEITVIMPYYEKIKENAFIKAEKIAEFNLELGWRKLYCGVLRSKSRIKNLSYLFIDNEDYFSGSSLYGSFNDGERFAYFCKAVCDMMPAIDTFPDVIHINDWQSALIPAFLKTLYRDDARYCGVKTVFTIHNIEYQGKAGNDFLNDVLGLPEWIRPAMTHNGCINAMKGAIELADKITTVSETYSYEIRHAYFASGLENVLLHNGYKIEGVINGIDTVKYNPRTDTKIYENFGPGEIEIKKRNKEKLFAELGMDGDADVPLFAIISRLVAHKGMELIEFVADQIMQQNLKLVVLGQGDARFEQMFGELAKRYPGRVSVNIRFDGTLASKIYAAADFMLLPSKSEPCGLAQMIGMRYGAVPVVRETGGLFDTVPAINTEDRTGRGFTFKLFNAHDMLGAITRAAELYYGDLEIRRELVKNIMKTDFSWKKSADKYMKIYSELCCEGQVSAD